MNWAGLLAALALASGALGIVGAVVRNRRLRLRPGNVPVRLHRPGKSRWLPAHGVWAHDVFAVRPAPAAWREVLLWVADARIRPANAEERKRLHRIGDRPMICVLELEAGGLIEVAARNEHADALLGPFVERRLD